MVRGRRPEKPSPRGFPYRNRDRVANPDRGWRRLPILPEAPVKALRRLRQQCRDDTGVDVDNVVADLILLDPLVDNLTRRWPGGRKISTSGKGGGDEASTGGGELHRRGMVSTPGTIFYYYEDQRKTFQALQAIQRSAEHRTSPGYPSANGPIRHRHG